MYSPRLVLHLGWVTWPERSARLSVANPAHSTGFVLWLRCMARATAETAEIVLQAIISGTFSIIRQSLMLGCFPRVKIVHTSGLVEGQIYIPEANWIMMVLTIIVVAGFRDQDAISNAYGALALRQVSSC